MTKKKRQNHNTQNQNLNLNRIFLFSDIKNLCPWCLRQVGSWYIFIFKLLNVHLFNKPKGDISSTHFIQQPNAQKLSGKSQGPIASYAK